MEEKKLDITKELIDSYKRLMFSYKKAIELGIVQEHDSIKNLIMEIHKKALKKQISKVLGVEENSINGEFVGMLIYGGYNDTPSDSNIKSLWKTFNDSETKLENTTVNNETQKNENIEPEKEVVNPEENNKLEEDISLDPTDAEMIVAGTKKGDSSEGINDIVEYNDEISTEEDKKPKKEETKLEEEPKQEENISLDPTDDEMIVAGTKKGDSSEDINDIVEYNEELSTEEDKEPKKEETKLDEEPKQEETISLDPTDDEMIVAGTKLGNLPNGIGTMIEYEEELKTEETNETTNSVEPTDSEMIIAGTKEGELPELVGTVIEYEEKNETNAKQNGIIPASQLVSGEDIDEDNTELMSMFDTTAPQNVNEKTEEKELVLKI